MIIISAKTRLESSQRFRISFVMTKAWKG